MRTGGSSLSGKRNGVGTCRGSGRLATVPGGGGEEQMSVRGETVESVVSRGAKAVAARGARGVAARGVGVVAARGAGAVAAQGAGVMAARGAGVVAAWGTGVVAAPDEGALAARGAGPVGSVGGRSLGAGRVGAQKAYGVRWRGGARGDPPGLYRRGAWTSACERVIHKVDVAGLRRSAPCSVRLSLTFPVLSHAPLTNGLASLSPSPPSPHLYHNHPSSHFYHDGEGIPLRLPRFRELCRLQLWRREWPVGSAGGAERRPRF